MDFFQQGPVLTNTYEGDPILRAHLERLLPAPVLTGLTPSLQTLGQQAATELLALGEQAEREQPHLEHYDPWGRRIDRIGVSQAWTALHRVQADLGLAAIPYEDGYGPEARVVQMALAHLYGPSSATYTCPVSMTDAATRVLTEAADPELRDRVVPHLISRAADAWTSGQWMTEKPGGSDVGRTETVAKPLADGGYALHGVKWFTSATTANCALALARTLDTDGHGVAGSRGLGLYLVELVDPRDESSQIGRTILVRRLKDKLGTKSLPTAELDLEGAYATLVGDPHRGVKTITGMLNVTRLWNAYAAAHLQARGLQLALSYADHREAFGARLLDLPLHRETLADLAVEYEATLALVSRAAELMGRVEDRGEAAGDDGLTLRGLMPVVKLLTAKTAVASASEVVDSFGGMGYVETTPIPALLRNTQVLSIWEGTTNVLALDLLRAAVREGALSAVLADAVERMAGADVPVLAEDIRLITDEVRTLIEAAEAFAEVEVVDVEVGMRTYAMNLGHVYSAALLVEHAAYRLDKHDDDAPVAVVGRYVQRHLGPRWSPIPTPARRQATDAILRGAGTSD
ncbi:acyl-CoA dehydrogenase family protein [soil metagenome]